MAIEGMGSEVESEALDLLTSRSAPHLRSLEENHRRATARGGERSCEPGKAPSHDNQIGHSFDSFITTTFEGSKR
jgi:hypothetical protein